MLILTPLIVDAQSTDYWTKWTANLGNQNGDDSNSVSNRSGVILPATTIAVLVIALAILMVLRPYCKYGTNFTGEPEMQINLVLCQEDNAEYEYTVVFRVGRPTPTFDIKNAYIDFEILGPKDEVIGCPVRFDCSLLPDPIYGEMHCVVGRVTPMPAITGICAYHNDRTGQIFLYEYVLQDCDDNVIEVRRFHVYLTHKRTTYRGKPFTGEEEEANENVDTPELPLMQWTNTEIVVISSLIVSFVGAMVMLAEYFDAYPVDEKQDGSLNRALFDVLYTSPLALALLAVVALLYKYYFKRWVLIVDNILMCSTSQECSSMRVCTQPSPSSSVARRVQVLSMGGSVLCDLSRLSVDRLWDEHLTCAVTVLVWSSAHHMCASVWHLEHYQQVALV